eukprot:COSAG04_NODE_29759_length_267_cov_0.607143_2_plen_31_part_01
MLLIRNRTFFDFIFSRDTGAVMCVMNTARAI